MAEGPRGLPVGAGSDRRREARRVTWWYAGCLPGTAEPITLTTDAFEARALQHEIDHCGGLLFLDRVAGPHALYARQVYQ